MLSDKSQSQNDKYYMIPLNMRYLKQSFLEMMVTRGWEQGEKSCLMQDKDLEISFTTI